eukprot:scaffold2265_cov198-Pinguiococcus_pyrenoidosus.AAC.1
MAVRRYHFVQRQPQNAGAELNSLRRRDLEEVHLLSTLFSTSVRGPASSYGDGATRTLDQARNVTRDGIVGFQRRCEEAEDQDLREIAKHRGPFALMQKPETRRGTLMKSARESRKSAVETVQTPQSTEDLLTAERRWIIDLTCLSKMFFGHARAGSKRLDTAGNAIGPGCRTCRSEARLENLARLVDRYVGSEACSGETDRSLIG